MMNTIRISLERRDEEVAMLRRDNHAMKQTLNEQRDDERVASEVSASQ